MADQKRRRKQFHGLDFATRTTAAWIGSWLPVWLLFGACDVEMPTALLVVTIVMAIVLKTGSYGSARTWHIVRISLLAAVLVFAFVQFETLSTGFRNCFDAIADAINGYYGAEIELFDVGSGGEYESLVFLLIPAYILLLLSDAASEGYSWVPWMAISFIFPWIAILVDAFCPVWYMCLYAGLVVYFLMTSESHVLRVAHGATFRAVTAIGLTLMLFLSSAIVSETVYDEKIRDWKGRQAIGNYLSTHFPKLFGGSNTAKPHGDSTGLSGGKLPKGGKLQHNNGTVGAVTLPADYGMLYLRTSVYGDYTGTAWVGIDDYAELVGARSSAFRFAAELPVSIEQYYMEYTGETSVDLRYALRRVPIDIDLYNENTILPLPYNSLYPYMDDVKLKEEGYAVFADAKSRSYTVQCYCNALQLPGSMAYALDIHQPTGSYDVPLDYDTQRLMQAYTEYVYTHYLTIPDSCPSAKKLLTRKVDEDDFDCIRKVQDFLRDHYAYTTRPGELPEGEDFIEYFLTENKKGYCSYYASAAVMLLRSLNIPARYAEGYAVESGIVASSPSAGQRTVIVHSENGDISQKAVDYVSVEISEQYAHAWVEVYLDGYGWYPVEVTNSNGASDLEYALDMASIREHLATPTPAPTVTTKPLTPRVTPGGKNTPTPKPTVTPGGKTTPTPNGGTNPNGDPPGTESNSNDGLRTLLHALLIIALIAAPIVFIGVRYTHRQRVRRKYAYQSDLNASYVYLCREIGRVVRLRGLAYDRFEADSAYLARAGKKYGHEEDFAELYETGNRAAYSGEKITKEDRRIAQSLYRVLRKETLAEKSLPKRLWLKFIKVI
ncbi:MAG: hypothetical protein J6Y67_02795 [Lachnospiraceae bacterium]|nr:hypothetical protein [Lachnospiraceae bacterium]